LKRHVADHEEQLDRDAEMKPGAKNSAETSLWGIGIISFMFMVYAWTLPTPSAGDPAAKDSKSVSASAKTAAAAPPVSAAAAIAEGDALVKRGKAAEAAGRAIIAGKPSPLPSVAPITKDEWANSKTRLAAIEKGAPEYVKAQALLVAMAAQDKRDAEFTAALESKLRIANRKNFAEKLEQSFLDMRMDADVSAVGPGFTKLRIRYALVTKVTANDLTKSGVIDQAQEAGFKKVEFTDGHYSAWTWDLD
jgi:hypothetical protein